MQNEALVFGIIFTSLMIFVLITGITIVFYVARQQRIKQQMQIVENNLLFEKELRQVETEVSERLLQHVGAELHDNIAQYHTAMSIQIENLKIDYPNMINVFAPLEAYLGEVTTQIRVLGRTLNSDYIGSVGIVKAIDIETQRIAALRRFKVNFLNEGDLVHLTKEHELLLFRCFQEIVQNALKHSGANNLNISLKGNFNHLQLIIHDDGRGFDVEETLKKRNTAGLNNILKRIELAGLECHIQSTIGAGSQYTIKTRKS